MVSLPILVLSSVAGWPWSSYSISPKISISPIKRGAIILNIPHMRVGASQVALVIKNPSTDAGDVRDTGSIPGLGRSLEEGTATRSSIPAWNPMDRGAWWDTVHGVTKTGTHLRWLSTYAYESAKDYIRCWCSVARSCPTLCDPMTCSTPGFPVLHYLPDFAQTLVHWVGDAIQPAHPLSSPSPVVSLFLHQGLFQLVRSLHQVAKVLEFQLQDQSFQWMFRTYFL